MRHSLGIVLAEIARILPQRAGKLNVDRMIRIRDRAASDLNGKVFNLEEVRLISFQRTLKYCGFSDDELAKRLNELYLKHRFEDVVLFDDAMPTLKALKNRYILGVMSNGNSYPEKIGLEDHFSFIILAQEVGIEKPEPEIFHLAAEKAGCLPEELLYVGDSQESDIVGAKKAGVRVAWYNRTDARLLPEIPQPDYEINRLTELLDIL